MVEQYLVSTYAVEGAVPGAPRSPDECQAFMERVMALEAEMDAQGVFVFGGALADPGAAHVVLPEDHEPISTGSPPVAASPILAGFYIINARDDEDAMAWGRRVATATSHPIEVRPFRATGRLRA